MAPSECAVITQDRAHAIVAERIAGIAPPDANDTWVVLPQKTIHYGSGWIVHFNSNQYAQTGNPIYAVAGNGPFLVDWRTGETQAAGTAYPIETYVKEFASRAPRAST